jgi:uncharacterized MAPEG superfamily protein
MAVELQYLVWAVALALAQMLVAVLTAIGKVGMPPLLGNREGFTPPEGLAGRARRAYHNMLESLVPFGLLVLVAVAAGKTGPMTALGAEVFFFARVGYALVYLGGIPWLRTLVWGVGLIGILLVFSRVI